MIAMLSLGGVAGGAMGILCVTVLFALAVSLTVFWIWMLVDCAQNKGLTDSERTLWVLAIVFFHFVGSLLYFFIGRPRRTLPPVQPLKPAT